MVGEVLQDRWLDSVFVDPLGGRGVAPAGAIRPGLCGGPVPGGGGPAGAALPGPRWNSCPPTSRCGRVISSAPAMITAGADARLADTWTVSHWMASAVSISARALRAPVSRARQV